MGGKCDLFCFIQRTRPLEHKSQMTMNMQHVMFGSVLVAFAAHELEPTLFAIRANKPHLPNSPSDNQVAPLKIISHPGYCRNFRIDHQAHLAPPSDLSPVH